MKISTEYWAKPIPDRSCDWSAIDSSTHDCDADQDGFFSTHPMGHGRTEAEAIADLLEQIDDEARLRIEERRDEGQFGVGA